MLAAFLTGNGSLNRVDFRGFLRRVLVDIAEELQIQLHLERVTSLE